MTCIRYKTRATYGAFALALLTLPQSASAQIECLSTLQHTSLTPAGSSQPVATSPDGRFIVVKSTAPNLVAGQELPTCGEDLFWLDTLTGTRALITHRPGEPNRCTGAAGDIFGGVAISNDGRFVAFSSQAPGLLAPGLDTNGRRDVFLYDQQTGQVVLVTRRADDPSRPVSTGGTAEGLSPAGTFVIFTSCSNASELVLGASSPVPGCNVYAFDRLASTVSLLSHRAGDLLTAGSGITTTTAVTPDARYIVFRSNAPDLVAGVTVDDHQIYRYDRQTASAHLISHQAGQPLIGADDWANGGGGISADGRFVAFNSSASDLVAGQVDENFEEDVFLADLVAGTTILVSGANRSPSITADAPAFANQLSPDGRFLVLSSEASNLMKGWTDDFGGGSDVFLFDRQDSSLRIVSRALDSATTMAGGEFRGMSDDGATVAFSRGTAWAFDRASGGIEVVQQQATGELFTPLEFLVFASRVPELAGSGDENGLFDVFRRDPGSESPTLLTTAAEPSPRTTAGGPSYAQVLTPDARFVVWSSTADFLLEDDTNQLADAFLFDRRSRVSTRVGPGGTEVYGVAMTPSGRHLLLEVDGQIHLHDRTLGQTRLISHQAGQPLVPSASGGTGLGLSDDGRFILFASGGADLIPGFVDRNAGSEDGDLFLYDVVAGQAQLVSHAAGLPNATGDGGVRLGLASVLSLAPTLRPRLTPDGRYVLFTSWASDYAAGFTDSPNTLDAYLFDRTTGQLEPLAVTAADPTRVSAGASLGIDLTPNGRFVVFAATGTDLVAGVTDNPNTHDVFVRDRMLGTTQLISHRGDSPTTTGSGTRSIPVALSLDGRFVLFQSDSPNLLPPPGVNPVTSRQNVFLYDRTLGRAELASRSLTDPRAGGNGDSLPVAMTPNGRTTLFATGASNLVAPPSTFRGATPLYLFDRVTGKQTWAGAGTAAGLSADGNTVIFTSRAFGLVPNDTNLAYDAFVYTTEIFVDGFESGSTAAWSSATP